MQHETAAAQVQLTLDSLSHAMSLSHTLPHTHMRTCHSNGHICLDILYDGQNGGWSPALTINKVCLSLRSMLASNTEKVRHDCSVWARRR